MVKKILPTQIRKLISKAYHGKKLTIQERKLLRIYVDSGKYHL